MCFRGFNREYIRVNRLPWAALVWLHNPRCRTLTGHWTRATDCKTSASVQTCPSGHEFEQTVCTHRLSSITYHAHAQVGHTRIENSSASQRQQVHVHCCIRIDSYCIRLLSPLVHTLRTGASRAWANLPKLGLWRRCDAPVTHVTCTTCYSHPRMVRPASAPLAALNHAVLQRSPPSRRGSTVHSAVLPSSGLPHSS